MQQKWAVKLARRKKQSTAKNSGKQKELLVLQEFQSLYKELEAILELVETVNDDAQLRTEKLQQASETLDSLQQVVNKHTDVLSNYDIQSRNKQVDVLRRKVTDLKIRPGLLFEKVRLMSLTTPKQVAESNNTVIRENCIPSTQPEQQVGLRESSALDGAESQKESERKALVASLLQSSEDNDVVLEGKTDETIQVFQYFPAKMPVENKQLILKNLTNCVIYLLECSISALKCQNLTGCKVFIAGCSGSTFLERVTCSDIYLSTRQLRVHHSSDSRFYLNIVSRPIIEYCQGIGFGSLTVVLATLAEEQSTPEATTNSHRWLLSLRVDDVAEVAENYWRKVSGSGNGALVKSLWKSVDDFRWMHQSQSPNWYVVDS